MPHRSETLLRSPARGPVVVDWRSRVARCWFWGGLALTLAWPPARESNLWLGWGPYWLLLAPLAVLAQLEAPRWLALARAAPLALARYATHRRPRRQARWRRAPPRGTAAVLRLSR